MQIEFGLLVVSFCRSYVAPLRRRHGLDCNLYFLSGSRLMSAMSSVSRGLNTDLSLPNRHNKQNLGRVCRSHANNI